MNSIKFDSTEIRNTTYIPQFAKHESIPEREISSLPLAREDGEIMVSEKFGIKRIILKGIITGTSQDNLESNIDTMKELFSRPEKNLDIEWNTSTVRYVATCKRLDFDRDHYHLLFCPWTAEFSVLSGEGKATSTTAALTEHVVNVSVGQTGEDTFTMSGGKPAKPVITIKGANFNSVNKGIEYKNMDTGERIVITRNKSWGTTDSIIIDCFNKKVTDNLASSIYSEGKFFGVFPNFKIGTNTIRIRVGGIVNQSSSENDDLTNIGDATNLNNTNNRNAQSFSVPYADDTFKSIRVALDKTGSPGNITWRVETDNGDKPSGTLAHANATGTITAASVSGTKAYITSYSSSLWSLSANTKYWLVLSAASVDGSNYFSVYYLPNLPALYTPYTKGHPSISSDGGSTWANTIGADVDYVFAILYGGEQASASVKHSVAYTKTYL